MSEMTKALLQAFFSLLHPRMLLLMLWPVLVALLLWLGLAFAFWSQAAGLQLQFDQSAAIGWAISVWPLLLVAAYLAWILLALLFIPLWPVLPVVLFGYLNQRVFRYDALAEHATGWEMETLIRRHRRELFLLGVVPALVGLIPLLGLFAPVYGGLAFIHYCLARLAQLRDEPVATQ